MSRLVVVKFFLYFGEFKILQFKTDRFCGLVATVSGYRSRGPGSIPGAIRSSEKQCV
jgi:hypothetical protein